MGIARNRSQTIVRQSGGRWFNNNPGNVIGAGQIATDFANCSDVTGYGDCAPFTVHKKTTSGGIINRSGAGAFASSFSNYPCDWLRTSANGPHLSVSGVPSDVELATDAAARTNPSRPYVDLPVNILDVRPGLQNIRENGWRLIDLVRRAGGQWLNMQFAVRPLISDMSKLIDIQQQIDRRVAIIDRLIDGQGIRRTVSQGGYTASSTTNQTVQSAGINITRSFTVVTNVRCSTHIRWKPNNRVPLPSTPREIRALASRAAHGITIDFSTLWEIMPWSWLIDYVSNTSEYLIASRNLIPISLLGVHPMKHTTTRWQCDPTTITFGSFTGCTSERETKTRSTSFVAPVAHLNFLNGNQMGILAALAATRLR